MTIIADMGKIMLEKFATSDKEVSGENQYLLGLNSKEDFSDIFCHEENG